jgi:hypothetical protein
MEHLMSSSEAKTAFNNLVASGVLKLHACYHSKNHFGYDGKITKLPMNNEQDFHLAGSLFDSERPHIYAANVLTRWQFRNDLGTASPTIALEDE